MPRFIPAFMCLALVVTAPPLFAQGPGAPPKATSEVAPDGPLDSRITGLWAPESDTTSRIAISSFGSGRIAISSPGRFTAIAFFDGQDLVGVVCPTREDGTSPRIDQPRMLRARYAEGPSLAVEFADTPTGPAGRRDVWRFRGALRAPMVRAPEPPAGEALPKWGEYVQVDELPVALQRVAPDYPRSALERGIEGTVLLQCLVSRTGHIVDVRIQRSIPELDASAVAAVRQWRFEPARAKGQPVAVWIAVPVNFSAR